MYKVEFNKSKLTNKVISNSSQCILLISLGVDAYAGNKLQNILRLINTNFRECKIIIGDTLRRHNYLFYPQHTKESYERMCIKEGEEWLNQNFSYFIKELHIPFKIIRWSHFITHRDYPKHLKKMEELCQTHNIYRETFKTTAEEYLNRQLDADILDRQKYMDACYNYLKEEAAAMCLWPKLNCEYEIYFNTRNSVMNLVYEDLLKPKYNNLLQPISLRFKKKKDDSDIKEVLDILALKNMVETLPGHIYWKNVDGVYLGCNLQLAHYYGYNSVSDIINKTDYDFFDKEVADKLRKNDLKIMRENSHVLLEERNKIDYFLSSKSSIKNFKGESIGIMGCSINITAKKEVEKKLQVQTSVLTEMVRVKDRFLNNVSHEIRTPIHVISAITNELFEEYYQLSDEERLEFIKLAKNTTSKLAKFVINILFTAKSKRGRLELHLENVDVLDLIKSVVEEIAVISSSKISIKTFNDSEPIIVNCTKYQIEQVIRNLLENAIKYGKNKPIQIAVSKVDNEAKVEVIDQGIGIPGEETVKIFEAFEEGSRTKNRAGGTGLGLTICKDIINLHKGKIWVNPKRRVGSHFIFTLPFVRKGNGKI